jgi:hypothetical protein
MFGRQWAIVDTSITPARAWTVLGRRALPGANFMRFRSSLDGWRFARERRARFGAEVALVCVVKVRSVERIAADLRAGRPRPG